MVVAILVMYRVNYRNTISSQTFKEQLNSIQKYLNFAAKLASGRKYTKRNHVAPLIKK